jgi:hypothetical protein
VRRTPLAWTACLGLLLSACAAYFAQESTLPHAYLEQARAAAEAHDAAKALTALDEADRASVTAPSGRSISSYNPATLQDIARARQSVTLGRWGDATYYIETALSDPSTLLPR